MAQYPVNNLSDEVLRCVICLDSVGTEPKTLRACGHTLCHNCYIKESLRRENVICPTCRTATYVGDGIRGGPVAINVMLKNVVEFVDVNKENMKRLTCNVCKNANMDKVVCTGCSKKEAKKAELRAKPRYLYQYDHKSALDVVLSKRNDKGKAKIGEKRTEEKDQAVKTGKKADEEIKIEGKDEEEELVEEEKEKNNTDVLDQLDPECVVQ